MTQLNDKDHKAQIEDMKSFDEQMPCVGIFWYDPEEHQFFGVHKKELTPREVEEAAEKGVYHIEYTVNTAEQIEDKKQLSTINSKLSTSSMVPRGRVAWNVNKFIVLVGKWAEPIQEELTELLEQEFSLPYFEFVYDHHWDLGHGWSGDIPTSR